MPKQFVHLHNHLDYSILDGAAKATALAQEAGRLAMPALAMTDHGNLHGAYEFHKACTAAGVKPIIGLETYLSPGDVPRTTRQKVQWGNGGQDDVSGGGAYTHMTLLATSSESMRNLFRLNSESWASGFYFKPRADRELLRRYGRGLIATTGCPSGEVQTLLRMGHYDRARAVAEEMADIFGPGHFFVEVMDHGLTIEKRAMDGLLRLAKDLSLPLLATNDVHYTHAHQAQAHDALLCINSAANLADPTRFKFDGSGFYLKSADEMRALWRDLPEACDNTLLVAEMCEMSFDEGQNLMPRFPVPDGETEDSVFEKAVWDGLAGRYPNGVPEDRATQARYEIGVITSMGFSGYFLVVADFINWAKRQGIRVGPGRGSGAGSIAAYAMRITDLDPVVHGLIFERFLNPDRVSMPDFDIDFDETRRGEVINYVIDKYGQEKVAQIVTFGTIKAKQAIKDSARIHGFPYALGDRLSGKFPPPVMGKTISLDEAFDRTHPRYGEGSDFRAAVADDPDAARIVETARGVEGFIRSTGVHPAGVIMSAEPLADVIPLMKREADGAIITQFEFPVCETLGMVKMDFLGLSNLTTIDTALANIKANRGIEVDLTALDATLDDPGVYDLLARGDTLGVFQFDGAQMRALLRAMRPDNFEDISAVSALYRPGPMGVNAHNDYADRKNGRKPVKPIHPDLAEALEPILGDTYGLIVYQEQVMEIARSLAGYSLGAADLLRRAMGKKKKEVLDKEFIPFRDGMRARGFADAAINELWTTLVPFADYAFNKAHSAAYGVISYYTAYLKVHYPAEYMAALLTTYADDKDKARVYLAECRRMGISVLSPDVNDSRWEYTAVGDAIRVGFCAVRNVGAGVAAAIVDGRTHSPYTCFNDYLAKVGLDGCQKRPLESLILAGAFDSLGHSRRALVQVHAQAAESYASLKKQEAIGQDSLFGAFEDDVPADQAILAVAIPAVEEWDKRIKLAHERDMLGLYVSDHPLNGVGPILRARTEHTIGSVRDNDRLVDTTLTIGGLITDLERRVTRKGDPWASFTLEDLDGTLTVLCFPNTYQRAASMLADDVFCTVRGKVARNDDGTLKMLAEQVEIIDTDTATSEPLPLQITVHEAKLTDARITELREVLTRYPGDVPVHLRVVGDTKTTVYGIPASTYGVERCKDLTVDLKALFGIDCLAPVATATIAAA